MYDDIKAYAQQSRGYHEKYQEHYRKKITEVLSQYDITKNGNKLDTKAVIEEILKNL